MDITNALGAAPGRSWGVSAIWMAYTVVGGMLPLWGTIVYAEMFDIPYSAADLTSKGEFILYAAPFLSTAIFVATKDWFEGGRPFPSRGFCVLVLLVPLILAAFIFAPISGSLLPGAVLGGMRAPDQAFVQATCWAMLPASMFLAYFVSVADDARLGDDISGIRSAQARKLEKSFDDLGDAE